MDPGRAGVLTHSLTTGERYVKLAQAVPGVYMLYVVNRSGVPSVGRRVDLKPEIRDVNDETWQQQLT